MTDDLGAPDAAEPPVDDVVQARAIQEFWEQTRHRAGLGTLTNVVVAASWGEEVPPGAWSFGDSPKQADESLALMLRGGKTGTSAALTEFEAVGEPLPHVGGLSVVLDGSGAPRALVRTTAVEVVAFVAVTQEFARAEGVGDGTLASWRAGQERHWRRVLPELGAQFDPAMAVVCERFEVLHPR